MAAAVYNTDQRRKKEAPLINPLDFFGSDAARAEDELTPGIRPAEEILAELKRATNAINRGGVN